MESLFSMWEVMRRSDFASRFRSFRNWPEPYGESTCP